MKFLDQIDENVKCNPNKVVLVDDNTPKGITFAQVYDLSGRVYNYLKSNGIGKEDFVLICLPRGVLPIVTMLGVWRAGAAFVLVEDHYAPERIEYIKNDCGCKLVIDLQLCEKMQTLPSLKGHENVDEHDACYAVYTSGTTGNPKGVIHEYGNIDRCIESLKVREGRKFIVEPDVRFALPAPLNFVASTLIIAFGLYIEGTIYVVSYSTIKNPLSVGLYYIKNKISATFLTPSYCKMFKKTPFLNTLVIGSEPASNIYFEGVDTFNLYTMSEGGFVVSAFLIDKPYPATPIGKCPIEEANVRLLKEDGTLAKDGEQGEIIYDSPYVRGYINLKEENERVFRSGVYHTGDIAKKDENGNLVICGRINDMVKINGNRVEPGEIEEATKKVLKIKWCAAKAIQDGDQIYIACYYTDKIDVNFEETRAKLEKILPYYMLPSYFVHIDKAPLTNSGKLDRKALPKPNIDDYKGEYVAPRDEIETALCNAFMQALGVDKVGINDDFYQLGGDSLTSMDVLVKSELKGLSTADIFMGHTPAKIAKLYKENHLNEDGISDDELDDEARKKQYYLSAYQQYMIDYQLYTPMSTMLNLFNLVKVDKETFDLETLAQAACDAINNHPGLLTKFKFNLDGDIVQSYEENYKAEVKIEKMPQEEFDKIKDELVQPFKVINSKLYRVRIIETEKYGYLFFDVHHTVFDGTSFKVFLADVGKAYAGMPLDRDYYYYLLSQRIDIEKTEKYHEDKEYFEKLYNFEDFLKRPKSDFHVRENTLGQKTAPLQEFTDGVSKLEKKYDVSRNEFFNTVALLSIGIYNRIQNVKCSWTYNGRDDLKKMTSTGLYLKDLPVALRLSKKDIIEKIFTNIKKQVNDGIAHSAYPYTMINANVFKDDMVCLLYQQDIRDIGDFDIEQVDIKQNNAAAENIMDIQVLDGEDGLVLVIDYASSAYKEESIDRYITIFKSVIKNLIYFGLKDKQKISKVIKRASKEAGDKKWRIK